MAVCYTGNPDETERALAPIRALRNPVFDLLAVQSYVQIQSYLDETEPKGYHYYWKTEYLPGVSDQLLSTMRDLFADCPIPGAELGLLHLAGAVNERDPDDGAVGNRDARFVAGVNGMWAPGEPDAQKFQQWIRQAGERLRQFSTDATYINFQTADEPEDRIRATYRGNFQRLVEIKRRYDPENLLRVNRNIPVISGARIGDPR